MWIKPFANFAPRMRVLRYVSERRLQTPNLAAHYKKELRKLLQVQRHSLSSTILTYMTFCLAVCPAC